MNRQEHLLECLSEECNEVGQRVSKALRFGLCEKQRNQPFTNRDRIVGELKDLFAVATILMDEGVIEAFIPAPDEVGAKRAKIERYMEIARAEGALPESSRAATDLLEERRRQIMVEGWTPEHDDAHDNGEMADAAALYASMRVRHITGFATWPWDAKWWKPTNPRRDLVKAGALIVAEIERIDRAADKKVGGA